MLLLGRFAVTTLEALNHSCCINQLLPACVERMADITDLEPQLLLGRTSLERGATSAANLDVMVLRMYSCLHHTPPLSLYGQGAAIIRIHHRSGKKRLGWARGLPLWAPD